MKTKQPININPFSVRIPITALVSVTHRLSGILVFLLIPLLLSVLGQSLASPEGLAQVKECWQGPICKSAVWLFLAGLIFHFFAGIRHLLMDVHIGGSLRAGRFSAILVIVCTLVCIVAAYWLWGTP